jgi:phenylalanyl-tRNA synthetase beta chain
MVSDGDGSRAVGIGGIMGGAETEISFSTKNALIECAWFDPIAIRRAARSLKLHTEASTRFGRGADPEMADLASRRAAELILEVAGGELLSGVVDIYPGKRAAKKISLRRAEFLRVMGADCPDKDIEAILSGLGFSPVRTDHNRGSANSLLAVWECSEPSWRADVGREIDLVEEVARVYGLDKFPPRLPASRTGATRLPHQEAETSLRERLIGLGYREILTIPHVSEDRNELFRPAEAVPARLANPLSEEAGVLKSTGAVTMAAAIERNLNHGQRDVRLFEIGHHYRLVNGKSVETRVLTIGATGAARAQGLYDPAREYNFGDLKGDLDAIGALSGALRWEHGGPDWLNAARRGTIFLGKEGQQPLGVAGQLGKRVADRLKFRQDVYLAEMALGPLYCMYYGVKNNRRYQSLPRFPGVERDFSLFLADGITFAEVATTIESLRIPEVASVEAADLFRGKNVPAGKYSLLVRVTFQSRESTFTDAQINDLSARIVAVLEKNLGATLRASQRDP